MTVDDNTGTPTGPSDDDVQPVEPQSVEPAPAEPVADQPTVAEPVAAVVEPVAAEPTVVEPVAVETVVVQPTVAEPVAAVVEPVVAEPVAVAAPPVVVEPVLGEPTPEQFASEDEADDAVQAEAGVLVGAGAVARSARTTEVGPSSLRVSSVKTAEAKRSRGPFGLLKARIARIATFYRQVVAELRKVIWPTRKELITYTSVVLVFVFVMVTIVGVFDFAFGQAVIKVFGA